LNAYLRLIADHFSFKWLKDSLVAFYGVLVAMAERERSNSFSVSDTTQGHFRYFPLK
jgi:hypothetical protein